MRRRMRLTIVALLVSAVACGGSPTTPDVPPTVPVVPPGSVLSLQAGIYALDLIGFGGSQDPESLPVTPCFARRSNRGLDNCVSRSRTGRLGCADVDLTWEPRTPVSPDR